MLVDCGGFDGRGGFVRTGRRPEIGGAVEGFSSDGFCVESSFDGFTVR